LQYSFIRRPFIYGVGGLYKNPEGVRQALKTNEIVSVFELTFLVISAIDNFLTCSYYYSM
jgi:hypothetical protein